MTGKELIIYILEHDLLEADLPEILSDFIVPGWKYAADNGMGVLTVETLFELGKLSGMRLGKEIYIFNKQGKDENVET